MGRTVAANPPAYRDDPSYDDAVSLHTTRAEDDAPELMAEDMLGEPPSYTDATRPPAGRNNLGSGIDPNAFNPEIEGSLHQRSNGSNYIISEELGEYDNYATDPDRLFQLITTLGRVPPLKMVRLKGTHKQTIKNGDKSETKTVTDFEVKLRLTEYLLAPSGESAWKETRPVDSDESTYRGTIMKQRASLAQVEEGEVSILGWCERFCNDPAKLKTFRYFRDVTGLNEQYLRQRLEFLVRNTNYKGRLEVDFPIDNPSLEIYSNHRLNKLRNNWAAIILSFITLTFLIFWPILFFLTKRYEVVKTEWPFSKTDETSGRTLYATISEQQWYDQWATLIEKAVVGQQQVTITQEDLARSTQAGSTQVVTGNEIVDGAANLFGAGMQMYNAVNRAAGWGYDS